jgi:hypothetical protein
MNKPAFTRNSRGMTLVHLVYWKKKEKKNCLRHKDYVYWIKSVILGDKIKYRISFYYRKDK